MNQAEEANKAAARSREQEKELGRGEDDSEREMYGR